MKSPTIRPTTFLAALTLIFALDANSQDRLQSAADAFFHKADTFLLFNKRDSSLYYFRKAATLYQETRNVKGLVDAKNKISENLSADFLLKEAMQEAKEAYALADEHLGEFSFGKADALNNIGNIHYLTGQHEQALEEYTTALQIIESVKDTTEHLYAAPTNLGIGNVYYGKHQYAEAFRYFKTALQANSQLLGEDHPYVANSYLSLGNLYRNKGSYNLAKENYQKALDINMSFFGERHPDVASTYIGIGDIYSSSGAYEVALQYYYQALGIFTEALNPINPKFGDLYLSMAEVFKNQRRFEEALEYYEKALEIYRKTIGELHQNSVRSNLGIGNTYVYQEKFKESLDYYNKVMEVNFNLVGEMHVNTSAAYNNLGSIYYFFGNFDLSIRYFKMALEIDLVIHGRKHPNVANAYYNIGRVYGEKGETALALEYVQEAINSSIIDFEEDNIFVNPALVNFFDTKDLLWFLRFKGEMLESGFKTSANMKGMDIALNSFILSDSLVEEIRKSYTDRRDQIELGKLANKIYESAVGASYSMLTMLNRDNVKQIDRDAVYAEKLKEYQNRFFFFTEKNKGAVLFSSIAEANAKSFGGIPDSLLEKETRLKVAIMQYTQELAANPDSSMRAYYQAELFRVNREYEALVLQMEHDFPKYYELKYDISVASLEEVQQTLDEQTLMVTYFVTDKLFYTAYISRDTMEVFRQPKHPDYEKWITAFRKGLIYKSDHAFRTFGTLLYGQLFPAPIDPKYQKLIVIQDGVMSTIPFEALPVTRPADGAPPKDYDFLIRHQAVSYAYSANLLHKTFYNEKILRPKATRQLFALAPVDFDQSLLDILRQIKQSAYEEDPLSKAKSGSTGVGSLVSLPGTAVEMEVIGSRYDQNLSELMMRQGATEANMKRGQMQDYQYVHIASHGFVNQQEPEFSGIFLGTDSLHTQDGILFSGEIYSMDLNAELVTLSACETGLGKISQGEGIIGLSRALIYAGAKNITVSLWKVMDQSTMELMTHFYEGFASWPVPNSLTESLSYTTALQQSKLRLIEEGTFAAPYYWSPFILIGK